ncbi:Zinc finger and BTB domain-containing protein 24 [Echinococcus granulosus]|uniref:Zinc finger and BTB domain-containing protein 24 n=1 Tax=Echinococcus granulosus TaxID=6210 RepID=W6UCS6_ECHGR|nr:Zinc finger and BTB domain-containing protein 24 [Echinococcus granulosus]EUB59090.1 Zinc finger and BTB domain-containing protein 24 [Echinococcus granulosus]
MVKRPSKKVHLDPNDPKITSIKGSVSRLRDSSTFNLLLILHLQFLESSLTAGPCPICGTVMATRHGMRRHFKIMHKHALFIPLLEAEASACKICGRKFLTTFAIQRHMRRVHPDEMNDTPPFRNVDGENPTSCPFCFKNFSGKQSLDRHLRIVHQHVEIGICSICDKTFSNKFAMKRHYENVHAEWIDQSIFLRETSCKIRSVYVQTCTFLLIKRYFCMSRSFFRRRITFM